MSQSQAAARGAPDARSTPEREPSGADNPSEAHPDERGPGGLTLDLLFELLSNSRRRGVLRYLEAHQEPVEIGPLAETLAADEMDKPASALTSTERKRLYIALYQAHLPKLADAGVIRYERPRGTVESTWRVAELVAYLDRVADQFGDAQPVGRSTPPVGLQAVTSLAQEVTSRLDERRPSV